MFNHLKIFLSEEKNEKKTKRQKDKKTKNK
jgi:hypothetical protein